MESFICECGGHFKLNSGEVMWDKDFLPYYDETLKLTVTSPKHRNREFKKAGLYVSQDDKKMMKRWEHQRKFKEDIAQETFAREGKTYKPGRGLCWSEKHQDFVPAKYLG
jgi:hypothetical protein